MALSSDENFATELATKQLIPNVLLAVGAILVTMGFTTLTLVFNPDIPKELARVYEQYAWVEIILGMVIVLITFVGAVSLHPLMMKWKRKQQEKALEDAKASFVKGNNISTLAESLKKLATLNEEKILTDDEFQQIKSKLIENVLKICKETDKKEIDDQLFDYVLTRLRTRESSTLVIATVASSASLVLFTVDTTHINPMLTYLAGFFFPFLGLVYRELTLRTIHQADFEDIHLIMNNAQKELKANKSDFIRRTGKLRGGIIRSFLLIPSLAWSLIAFNYDPLATSVFAIAFFFAVYMLGFLEWRQRDRQEKS